MHPHSGTTPAWLTTAELAAYLGVSTGTVLALARQPDFPDGARMLDCDMAIWDREKVVAWLRTRPLQKRGRLPKWLLKTGHVELERLKG